MNYQKILKKSIDLHVHIGPEIIPRKFNLVELVNYEKDKLAGIAVKNHFFPTIAMNQINSITKPFIINSVVLNRYVGGFNPDIIRASAELSDKPIIVWFPTLHTKKFLDEQKFEIPREWIGGEQITRPKLTKNIKPLNILNKKGSVSNEVKNVLQTIKDYNAILATGHLSWSESLKLVEFATKKIGIKKVIITHPIYQKIKMPINIQNKLVKAGALIEHCYSMYSIDKIAIKKIVNQIKIVGAKNCILSSDVGQIFSESPSEALVNFMSLLEKNGLTEGEIKVMLIDNPNKLLFKN